uniref:Abi-like protein n=1 Tax=Vitiosangium cumulatum TaxID=1867796 RepID=A0A7D4XGX2_9BACT|nr:hypothetical protein [Vitiosangium cumulatum]
MAPLETALSRPRLDNYRTSAADTPRIVMGRYLWNLALCKALYPGLQFLEVAFRNKLHDALKAHFGAAAWFDLPWLSSREQQKVADAKVELQKRQTPLEPDRIVAELSFGFWTSLLSGTYDQVIWNQRAVVRQSLPHMPNRLRTRRRISDRMHQIRLLRNRVFHYEPIWHWKNLAQQYAELRQTLQWFEPELLHLLHMPDSFEEVYMQGSVAYEIDVG